MAAEFPLTITIKALDKATAPLAKVNAAFAKFAAPLGKLNASFKNLGKETGFSKLVENGGKLKTALGNVGSEAKDLGLKLAGIAGGAAIGLYAIVRSAVDAGDSLGEMAQRVGLGVDAYASLSYAAAQADVDQEAFNGAMDKFNKSLGEAKAGGGSLLAFLNKVSPALAQQVKGATSTEDALQLMTSAFEKVTDPGKRAALAAAAFGKSGLQMGQFLGQGTYEVKRMRAEFLATAGSQEEFAKNAGELDNAMRKAETAFMGLRTAALGPLMPVFTQLAAAVTKFLVQNRDGIAKWANETAAAVKTWIDGGGLERLERSLRETAKTVGEMIEKCGGLKTIAAAAGLVMAGPFLNSIVQLAGPLTAAAGWVGRLVFSLGTMVFGPVIAGVGTFVTALGAGFTAMEAFNLVLLMNPIGVFVVAIAALAGAAYLVYKNWEPIKAFFESLWESMKHPLEALKTAGDFWGDTFKKVFPGTDDGFARAKRGELTEYERANGMFGYRPSGPTPAQAAPPPRSQLTATSEAKVQVEFKNPPPGMRVRPDSSNTAALDFLMGPTNLVSQ